MNYLLTLLCSPEILVVLGIIIPATRKWVRGLVEDSDGDPHHRDGFFLMVVWASKWCFCFAFIAGYYTITKDKNLLDIIITFLASGAALLGVRLFKNYLNLSIQDDKTLKHNEK